MTKVTVTKWGNSCGVRIPASELKAANIQVGDQLEIKAGAKGVLKLVSTKKVRDGWFDAFNKVADLGGDKPLIEDLENDFDEGDWTW